jgi:hypothetical protein
MKQQTAVDWLEKTIQSMIEHGADLGEDYPALMVHIQQAKEKFEQQIENAWDRGKYIGQFFSEKQIEVEYEQDAEQYYNETYKKD